MPIRRTSQPGSPVTLGSMAVAQSSVYAPGGSASSRFRQQQQQGELNREYGSISDFGAMSGRAGESSGEHRVVQALVGRLVNKLPANTGARLSTMEQDPAVQATIQSLIQLANARLPLVVQGLASALESLSKYSTSTHTSDVPLDTLQSQAFLLHVLHLCLTASWRQHAYRSSRPPSDLPRLWPDPPALDETTARYLLSTLLVYTRAVSSESTARPGSNSPAPSRERNRESAAAGAGRRSGPGDRGAIGGATYALGTKFLQARSFASAASPTRSTPPSLLGGNRYMASKCTSSTSTLAHMTRLVARTMFYLSASNWSLVLTRIKAKIAFLTTTIEESPDVTDLKLLHWVNLDRSRLGQLIHEISATFLHVKRPGQVAIAIGLRRAIWNFLDAYPDEYEALVESNRKMEGKPETLFDVLASAADITSTSSQRRTRAFYPLMAMLLVLCPDIMKRAVAGDVGQTSRSILGVGGNSSDGSGISKKAQFLESIRKGVSTAKGYEACALCLIDLARAALRLSPRFEAAGIRSFVADMQGDLKNALTSPLANDMSEPQAIIDGMVSLYRLQANSQNGVNVFSRWFAEGTDARKLLAVQACTLIIAEGNSLPWLPPVSGLWRATSANIRALLKTCASGIHGDISVLRRPVPAADIPEALADLTRHVLKLIALDPAFAFAGSSADQSPSDGLTLSLLCLSSLTVGPTPEDIRLQASLTIVSVLEHVALSVRGNESMAGALSSASTVFWQLLVDVSRQLMHDFHIFDFDGIATSADCLRMTVLAMLRVMEEAPEAVVFATNAWSAVLVGTVAGVMSVLALNLRATSQCQPMFSGLATIQQIVSDATADRLPPEAKSARQSESKRRVGLCRQLAALRPALGRQHLQRQLRSIIRDSAHPAPDMVALLISMSSAVKAMSGRIIAAESRSIASREPKRRGLTADIEGLDEELSRFWQDLVALTCPLTAISTEDLSSVPHITSLSGRGILPKQLDETTEPTQAVESFLRDCVDLLVSNTVTVRETVKEALGSELPHSLCGTLGTQMSSMLKHASGPGGMTPSEPFTIFIEQAISVLRTNVERLRAGLGPVDLGSLLLNIGQYVHRLGRDDTSLRLKSRYCALCEVVLRQSASVTVADFETFRFVLLEWVGEWSMDSPQDGEAYHITLDASGKAQRALETACLKTMIPLTENLVLRSSGDDAGSQSAMKSRLFLRYFSYLVKVLERNTATESDSFHRSRSLTNVSSHHEKAAPVDAAQNLAIAALSNLLSANVDVGLKHCLTLGYHDNMTLRSAFMQVVSRVMEQGMQLGATPGGFGGPGSNRLSNAPKPYLDLLKNGNLAFTVALVEACPPSEVDEISLLLFRVFEEKGTLLALLRVLVEREVTLTNHESELFRANSITTRLLTIYAKTYGYNYVRATLQPLVNSLCEKPEQCSFELDPSKAAPGEDIERNADHLRLMCQALLDLICSSIPRVPVMFRALCHHIWEVVEDRFPDSRHSAVGSFIFLRFFCPAIIAPESIDLDVRPDTPQIRRGMLLITKVIQNLANNVVFGTTKEPHMRILNQFLSENIRQVTKFLSDLAVRPRSMEVAQAIKMYQEDGERASDPVGDNTIIHSFASRHRAKLAELLGAMPASYRHANSARSSKSELEGRSAWTKLREVMELTGGPADNVALSPTARIKAYDEFMRQHQGRDDAAVAAAFYEGPVSQSGRRMFYFILSRAVLMDPDLLASRIFSMLEGVRDFLDIIIDLTDFSPLVEMPVTWMRRCLQICPPAILAWIHTITLYNPNSYAKKRLRRIMAELGAISGPVGKSIVAASSPAELAETITFTSLALPEETLELAYEADNVFTGLHVLATHEQQIPVVVKLGHGCLQIASWKKQDLAPGLKAYIIDIIRLKDIDDVLLGTGLASDHLIVKHSQTASTTFISRKRNEMGQIIRAARSRLRDVPSAERALRPGDVPGALLSVALLNMSASDEALRLGALNLAVQLSHFFKYELDGINAVSAGLAIPRNATAFASAISRQLAASASQLTLELLKEWTLGFAKGDITQKTACLQYIEPWLRNLGAFADPSRDDATDCTRQVIDIVRGLIAITVSERKSLQMLLHDSVWSTFVGARDHFVDLLFAELVHTAVDSGLESDKSETAAEILVTVASLSIRGRLVARLRKTIAQTYLVPSASLAENAAWSEICVLTRLNVLVSFNPQNAIDAQLFLPDIAHCITILLGSAPLVMRQMTYALLVNVLHNLTSAVPNGEMEFSALQTLQAKLQTSEAQAWFGLCAVPGTAEIVGASREDAASESLLAHIEDVARFLGQIMTAAAISIDCCNAWRARWMSLVAATCFQHNPATQPQAFTVLGYLASAEVDDDLVYQILVAMSTTLSQITDADTLLLVSMLRCLDRVVAGLLPESRYASSLFWLAVGVLQLSWIPVFPAALDLLVTSLRYMASSGLIPPGRSLTESLLETRRLAAGDAPSRLDDETGVSFDIDPHFSLAAILFKGVRHQSSRSLAIGALTELLKLSMTTQQQRTERTRRGGVAAGQVPPESLAYFASLLPVMASSPAELKALFGHAGIEIDEDHAGDISSLNIFDMLDIPDNSAALMLITMVVAMLSSASSEPERVVLYSLLADASSEIPDVLSMSYDTLVPRLIPVLGTSSNTTILQSVSTILERAMLDPAYTFGANGISSSGMQHSDSLNSLHTKAFGGSSTMTSSPSMAFTASMPGSGPASGPPSLGGADRAGSRGEAVLDELGMRGLTDINFPPGKMERVAPAARHVSALIESFTI